MDRLMKRINKMIGLSIGSIIAYIPMAILWIMVIVKLITSANNPKDLDNSLVFFIVGAFLCFIAHLCCFSVASKLIISTDFINHEINMKRRKMTILMLFFGGFATILYLGNAKKILEEDKTFVEDKIFDDFV